MAVAPKAKPTTINESLRDRGIAHALMLERLKQEEAAKIVAHFREEVLPDLLAKLTARMARIDDRGFDLGPATTKRLQDTIELMQEAVDAWTSGLSADLAEKAAEVGHAEVGWQRDLFTRILPIEWDMVMPPLAAVRAAVLESPIDGTLLSSIVDRLGAGTKTGIEKAIRIGISEGESIPKIAARVQSAGDLTATSAEAVARTAIGHASNAGRSSFYAENTDIIKGVQWHATLDTRTCASCGALDGKLFPVDSGARPPRHINCRCTTVPVLKSMRELGLDLDDFEPTTRASMTGQVPAALTYNEWLKRMPAEMQDEALGKTRGGLFRTGKVDVSDFVNARGDSYDLAELRKREAAAFTATA